MAAFLALLSSALWGTSDFVGGTLSRRVSAVAVVGASQAIALVGVVPAVLIFHAYRDPAGYLPWAVAAGLVGSVSLAAFYTALADGTMGIVAPIAATGVIVPVLIGVTGGDRPKIPQGIGIVLAVTGVVLASGPEFGAAERDAGRGGLRILLLACASAVGFGFVLWFVAKGSHYSVGMTLLWQRLTNATLALIALLVVRGTGGLTRRDIPILAVVGFGDVLANGMYALSTRLGLLSLVAVLGSVYPVVTVLLARYVHHERLRPIQNVGVIAALSGVVLIAGGGA
jgi:drug/metabolite transporter (DMT)-like permease